MFVTYTFDLSTLKVVREVTFTDEPAVAEKFAAVGRLSPARNPVA
ncbi:hypothetical protein [Rhodococcus opacus]|nr:hypothetical protein [Rhodococcus opacus]